MAEPGGEKPVDNMGSTSSSRPPKRPSQTDSADEPPAKKKVVPKCSDCGLVTNELQKHMEAAHPRSVPDIDNPTPTIAPVEVEKPEEMISLPSTSTGNFGTAAGAVARVDAAINTEQAIPGVPDKGKTKKSDDDIYDTSEETDVEEGPEKSGSGDYGLKDIYLPRSPESIHENAKRKTEQPGDAPKAEKDEKKESDPQTDAIEIKGNSTQDAAAGSTVETGEVTTSTETSETDAAEAASADGNEPSGEEEQASNDTDDEFKENSHEQNDGNETPEDVGDMNGPNFFQAMFDAIEERIVTEQAFLEELAIRRRYEYDMERRADPQFNKLRNAAPAGNIAVEDVVLPQPGPSRCCRQSNISLHFDANRIEEIRLNSEGIEIIGILEPEDDAIPPRVEAPHAQARSEEESAVEDDRYYPNRVEEIEIDSRLVSPAMGVEPEDDVALQLRRRQVTLEPGGEVQLDEL